MPPANFSLFSLSFPSLFFLGTPASASSVAGPASQGQIPHSRPQCMCSTLVDESLVPVSTLELLPSHAKMSGEEVVELSIEDTQRLRSKLGLPPLRGVGGCTGDGEPRQSSTDMNSAAGAPPASEGSKEEISLSVSETNALRAKIGLPPLKVDGDESKAGTSRSNAIHARPANTQAEAEARKRVEDATAKREAAAKVQALANEVKSDENELSAADFAAKMRAGNKSAESPKVKAKRKKKKKTLKSNPQLSLNDEDDEGQYTSADLAGLKVSHNAADFAAGSTTVLTLADQRIINVDGDTHKATDVNAAENELVNVNMDHDSQARENLKRKRQIELGSGRAGGYSGTPELILSMQMQNDLTFVFYFRL